MKNKIQNGTEHFGTHPKMKIIGNIYESPEILSL